MQLTEVSKDYARGYDDAVKSQQKRLRQQKALAARKSLLAKGWDRGHSAMGDSQPNPYRKSSAKPTEEIDESEGK